MAGNGLDKTNVLEFRTKDYEFNLCFDMEGERIGTLRYDLDDKMLKFDGQVDPSGRLFFDFVCEHFNGWLATGAPRDPLPDVMGQLRFNLTEAYGRIERLKEQVLELELAVASTPE